MYPTISFGDTFSIHTFGISMILGWVLFFWLLHFFALKKAMAQHIFWDILAFTIVPFLFGRVFHILAEWREEKFIFMDLIEGAWFYRFITHFFLTENYNLSFAGCVVGFMIVFFIKTRDNKKERPSYYDIIAPSFLIAGIVGYLGAYLGGQIYGIPYDGIFGITYDSKESNVPFRSSLFPLPFLYIFCIGLILGYLYRISKKWARLPDGFIWYLWIWLFWIVLFLAEFLNGSTDMLSSSFLHINFNQVVGLYFLLLAFIWLWKSLKIENFS
jgi:prolipoprotein diacylglyceryltransferase